MIIEPRYFCFRIPRKMAIHSTSSQLLEFDLSGHITQNHYSGYPLIPML